nr:methyltransferase domain-containing protein [uncultured Rhodopila sp.]
MRVDGYEFMVDSATKFFNTIRVFGWFHHPTDCLSGVQLIDPEQIAVISEVGCHHAGVAPNLGSENGKGFLLQSLRRTDTLAADTEIEFRTVTGWTRRVLLAELCADRISRYPGIQLDRVFVDAVNSIPEARVLDIGGRARSKIARGAEFNAAEYVVFDVMDGDNVNVVGDAHQLAAYFPANHFDAVLSTSVFEHLLMPWAVVAQMSRVLKTGGIGLIATHQTLGLHDMPWDFWRFSDTAWDALFNRHTGFEILQRTLDFDQYVLPVVMRPSKEDAEQSLGFEGSAVYVRKVGPCRMAWDLTVGDVITTAYPLT